MKFIDLDSQYDLIKKDLNHRLNKIFIKKDFIQGKEVRKLEDNLSKISKFRYVETCANGTDALSLSLKALLKENKHQHIIIPNYSYISSAEVIPLNGHIPVFVDVKSDFTICYDEIVKAFNLLKKRKKKVAAVIGVDLFGYECEHKKIYNFCRENNIKYIIDGAQSFTSFYHQHTEARNCDIWCTSFFPSKSLGCYGDGGAIFTQKQKIANYINALKKHGITNSKKKMLHEFVGINSRLDTIQAAVLNAKLKILPDELKKKNKIFNKLKLKIENENYYIPNPKNFIVPTVFTIISTNTKNLKLLKNKYKPNFTYYPLILSDQIAFKKIKKIIFSYKNSKKLTHSVVSIPYHPYL